MDNSVKSTIDNLSSVFGAITGSLQDYTAKALNEIKNMNPETESEIKPVIGYQTGDQGWYDTIGGGPCDTYCRYTGISPEVKWTCSPESELSNLVPTPKKTSGRYCYDYDGKTTPSKKNGVVVRGTYVETKPPMKAQSAGDYNFILARNKDAKGIEFFDNENIDDYENIENFQSVTSANFSPYQLQGANSDSPNNDITNNSNGDPQSCAQSCLDTPYCAGFVLENHETWNWDNPGWQPSNICYLKGSMPVSNLTPVSPGTYNAWNDYITGMNSYTINRNPPQNDPRFVGPERAVDISSLFTYSLTGGMNPVQCGQECNAAVKCTGFLTDDAGTQCYLLSGNTATVASLPGSTNNFYKMNGHFVIEDGLSLSDCENVCENDDTCKAFSYNTDKLECAISQDKLTTGGLNMNNIVGTKKQHLALNGTYNIYQNNSCINSNVFGSNPTVENSLGLKVNSNGSPIMPKQPICPSQMNNDFIFGKNFEIMTIQQDVGEDDTEYCSSDWWSGESCSGTDKSWNLTDAYCLQKNSDNSISTTTCTYGPNQKWTYDESLKNIRSWDGNCLNIDTENNNVNVSVKPCANDINQQFNLTPVAENLQPKFNVITTTNTVANIVNNSSGVAGAGTSSDSNWSWGGGGWDFFNNVENTNNAPNTTNNPINNAPNNITQSNQVENFSATNTNINNYLSSNRNNADYLYKLPYNTPYIKNINNSYENFQSMEDENTSRSLYLIYLIVLVVILVFLMRK